MCTVASDHMCALYVYTKIYLGIAMLLKKTTEQYISCTGPKELLYLKDFWPWVHVHILVEYTLQLLAHQKSTWFKLHIFSMVYSACSIRDRILILQFVKIKKENFTVMKFYLIPLIYKIEVLFHHYLKWDSVKICEKVAL